MKGTLSPYSETHFIFYPTPTANCFDEDGRLVYVPRIILVDHEGNGEDGWSLSF